MLKKTYKLTNQIFGSIAKVFPSDDDLSAWNTLDGGNASNHRRQWHDDERLSSINLSAMDKNDECTLKHLR